MPDFMKILSQIPIINLLPIFQDIATRIPTAYAAMPDEDKQAIAVGLLKLLAKEGK